MEALDVSKDEQAAAAEIFRGFKGDVENLLAAFAGESSYDRETAEYFHPGRSARARVNGAVVAQFGQIHPEVATARKLRQDVFMAEIDLEQLYKNRAAIGEVHAAREVSGGRAGFLVCVFRPMLSFEEHAEGRLEV